MAIDISHLLPDMLDAAKGVIGDKWPDAKDYATSEFKKIGKNIADIEALRLEGKITDEQARMHLEIQKNASQMVLLTVQGLGLLMAEQAINAALGVLKDFVNGVLGFALIR